MEDMFKNRYIKFYAGNESTLTINAVPGHFATSQSHINYYIDITRLKVRVKEAQHAAYAMRTKLLHHVSSVDTIVCLDNTEMLGGFLGSEMEKGDFYTANTHDTVYVISPDVNTGNNYTFRDNNTLAIEGKNVLILEGTVTTGQTLRRTIEAVEYYGGHAVGVIAVFSMLDQIDGMQIFSLFTRDDIPEYQVFTPHDCPYCKKKIPIEALVSGSGYTRL